VVDVAKKAVTVFYSYAPFSKDELLRATLEKHLAGLQRSGLIESWSRREIVVGKNQREEIDKHLEAASVILLLISPDFIASDYCYSAEMLRAMERHQSSDARVIPILLRPVHLEDEPFTQLATLPKNGKPISMWRNRDAAFAEIVGHISTSIKELQASSPSVHTIRENPPSFVYNGLNYFTSLATYLASEGRWFRKDSEQGRIYTPKKEYFAKIETLLNAKHRAILIGRAAAGKTTLALALAQYLQEQAGYVVGYKDVKHAEIGDGRTWYTLAKEHDQPNMLYILDNCHLAPREVDEFCSQWQERPPTFSQCLLIARTNQPEMQAEVNAYLQTFADDEKIEVRSENIYLQVIEQYITAVQQQRARYDETLKNDNLATLEKQHAHNLVISRDRLDVWEALGPEHRLSEVRQEDLYRALETKYLSSYGIALAKLCILQRYEIQAHTFYVEKQLAREEVKRLRQDKLLTHATVTGYGRLYDLELHPTEARELFIAHVFSQYGNVTQGNINTLVIAALEEYLRVKPSNFITVYDGLARQRHEDILQHLLTNHELQEITASQFAKENSLDAIRYVHKVAKVEREQATQLIEKLVRVVGVRGICDRLSKASFHDIALLVNFLKYINPELAQHIIDTLDMQQLAQQMAAESLQSLFRLLRETRGISSHQMSLLLSHVPLAALVVRTTVRNFQGTMNQLRAYDYPPVHMQQFVALLDMRQFAQQSERVSLQSLFWTLHLLEKVSSQQAQRLLRYIPLWMLSMKASTSNLGSVDQIIRLMVRYGYTGAEMIEFTDALDVEQVVQEAKEGNLRRLASFLRTLKAVAPTTVSRLLEILTPIEVAHFIHTQRATLDDLEQLRKAVPRAFWESFLQHCPAQDIADIFQRTPLGAVGTFLRYQYASRSVQEGYALFQEQFLQKRLATTTLEEMGEFLDRTQAIRQNGKAIASKAIELFLSTDITNRVEHTNFRQYALLLHHTRSIDSTYLPRLLAPLRQNGILRTALAASNIHGIQLLIFNVASIDEGYLSYLQQALVSSNITEKLEQASLRDIGLFLWNTYQHLDTGLAQTYCDYLDAQPGMQEYSDASPEDLCFFLWNLTSISNAETLRTFDELAIQQRLREGWSKEIGWSLVLRGVAATTRISYSLKRLVLSIHRHRDALLTWFTTTNAGHNPYYVALALQGLRTCNEEMARELVQHSLPIVGMRDLLVSAKTSAITTRSIALMDETIRWLEELLREL